MTDRELIAGSNSAVEELVRTAMAAGAVCLMEKAAAGEIDPRASLGDALGDFPAEFLKIRAGLVADAIAELAAQRPPLGYAVTVDDGSGGRWMQAGAVLPTLEEAVSRALFYRPADARAVELREVQP